MTVAAVSDTATFLQCDLEGAASQGAQTELIHLYDLQYTGCMSCFACKTKGGTSHGRCATQDDLTQMLDRVRDVDGIILGSPIHSTVVAARFDHERKAKRRLEVFPQDCEKAYAMRVRFEKAL